MGERGRFTEDFDAPPLYSDEQEREEANAERDKRRFSQASTVVEDTSKPPGHLGHRAGAREGSFWSRVHDKWCFVLFLTNFAAYNILAVYGINSLMKYYGGDLGNLGDIEVGTGEDLSTALDADAIYVFGTATGLAIGTSFALLFFVRQFPGFVIWTGPALCVIMLAASTGGLVYLKLWSAAVITGSVALLVLASLYFLKGKYHLARELLDTANMAAAAHWSVFWTVLVGLLASGIHALWNVFAMISIYLRFAPGQKACDAGEYCSSGVTTSLMVYILVSHLWIASVITNITIIIMAGGPYAQWWMSKDRSDRSETWWAFKKAVGTSLGSVAFGSLLVTVVEVIAFVMKVVTGEMFGWSFCSYCCICILNLLEKALEYFNKYVYIKIGVEEFEIGFGEAARKTLRFFRGKNRKNPTGLDAMLSDSIVGMALHMTCIATALLCTAITWIYSTILDGTLKVDNRWDFLILLYCFILTLNIGLVLTSALEAGVSTIFVCLDDSPWNLRERNRSFYMRLKDEDKKPWRTYREAVFDQDGRDKQPPRS